MLQRFAKTLVLAFDPDAAGQAAAERVYEWERKLEIDVAVADLPVGQDPGDLARSDPDRLRAADLRPHAVPGLPGRPGPRRPAGWTRPRAGPARPRRRWSWWPSTPTSSSATST